MFLTLGSAAVGLGLGLYQNQKRKEYSAQELQMARLNEELARHRLDSRKQILEGQLTIGAMQTSEQNKQNAIDAFQSKAAMETYAGTSGTSSGTPFFLLDQEINENRHRLHQAASAGRLSMDMMQLEGESAIREAQFNLLGSQYHLDEVHAQDKYINSFFGQSMAALTGAFSGMGMAASLDQSILQMTGFTIGQHFGGHTGPNGQAMPGTLHNWWGKTGIGSGALGPSGQWKKNYDDWNLWTGRKFPDSQYHTNKRMGRL